MRLGFVGFNGLELEALLAGLRFRASQVFTLDEVLPEGVVLDAVLASDSAWQAWSESNGSVVNPTLHLLPWLVLSACGGRWRQLQRTGFIRTRLASGPVQRWYWMSRNAG